jgi:hypothetical protein
MRSPDSREKCGDLIFLMDFNYQKWNGPLCKSHDLPEVPVRRLI